MGERISTEPQLFAGSKEQLDGNSEAIARVTRLISLQQSIARRPEVYFKAFTELGKEATAETLDIHDDAVETRDAIIDPKKKIKEYFAKRDDKELVLDDESDEAIYGTQEFEQLAKASREKTAIVKKKGKMGSEITDDPEAREASNAVRRHILGAYIGRAVIWKVQQESKKVKRAG